MLLGPLLPKDHLSSDSKDVVKMGMGLVGTMTAILLGLLVASAKNFYDAQATELTQISANVILLDRFLAHYGPEAKESRDLLKGAVGRVLETMWSRGDGQNLQKATAAAPGGAEILYDKIQALAPQNDIQHSLQNQALSIAIDLGKTRWLMLEQATNSVSIPLLVALVFWLAVIFCSFGLFAPRNLTVVATLAVCAISVSAAIFLILEMYTPFGGLLPISDAPLRSALEHLGK
jgi:hypothetical protein